MRRAAWKEKSIRLLLVGAATTSILIVALIFLFVGKEAAPFASEPGLDELIGRKWAPTSEKRESFGILPLVTGSLLVTGIATIVVIPFGVCGAVYISQVAGARERELLKPFIELLAGIPSVVIGFFGLVVLGPLLMRGLHLQSGLTALTGGLLLALMAAPTVISIAEDALRSVPESYSQGSLALGASKLQTIWKITVPAAKSGIVAAVMLGMGRVIGETMAVMMCTGNAAMVTLNPVESVRTMTATVAAEMGEVPFGGTHYRALFCVGIVLLLATFLLNMVAQRSLSKHRRY
jgi:phosphate transport system permease protein